MSLSSGIRLIVGLGNPGPDYAATRHNAGAWFVEALAQDNQCSLKRETRFHGLTGTINQTSTKLHLLIPQTFMNLSGQAVMALAKYYAIPPEQILVAHDDLDLAVGDIRLKFDGGHGGHNGLRDIMRHAGTQKFHRLRIGIGHPGKSENKKDVTDYVLKPPKKAERELIDHVLHQAHAVLPLLIQGHYQQAMQVLHTIEDKK